MAKSPYPTKVVQWVRNGFENCPDYMVTSNAEIKFGMKNFVYRSLRPMDGCLCFKENFRKRPACGQPSDY